MDGYTVECRERDGAQTPPDPLTTISVGAETMATKKCIKCGEEKPLDQFGVTRRRVASGWKPWPYPYCKPCRVKLNLADKRKHYQRARAAERKSKLKLNYGITPEDHSAQLAAQAWRCAICASDLNALSKQTVHVDHSHATGVLRGILCGPCNTGMGSFRDDIERMEAAIRYLKSGGVWIKRKAANIV
jgi:hypothetical protein